VGELVLEIVEGPGAGERIDLDRPIVVGRGTDADLMISDDQVSRRHARISPGGEGGARVEDLGSSNGTFLNHNQLESDARLEPGDELVVGVAVLELRTAEDIADRPTAQRAVPPGLAREPRQPDYVAAGLDEELAAPSGHSRGDRQLQSFLDVRVRRQAQLAPLALLMLIALVLSIYFATR
jgi:predicted component of type VI protein secretion system